MIDSAVEEAVMTQTAYFFHANPVFGVSSFQRHFKMRLARAKGILAEWENMNFIEKVDELKYKLRYNPPSLA